MGASPGQTWLAPRTLSRPRAGASQQRRWLQAELRVAARGPRAAHHPPCYCACSSGEAPGQGQPRGPAGPDAAHILALLGYLAPGGTCPLPSSRLPAPTPGAVGTSQAPAWRATLPWSPQPLLFSVRAMKTILCSSGSPAPPPLGARTPSVTPPVTPPQPSAPQASLGVPLFPLLPHLVPGTSWALLPWAMAP